MRTFPTRHRPSRIAAAFVLTFGTGFLLGPTYAAQPGAVDLLATPPELTASVAPNVVLTFDDSGSMAWEYMPDQRPFDGAGWGISSSISTSTAYPWFCAGRIDASVTDPANPRSKPMNGMYYDPNVTYRPPLLADGITQMPNANFNAAWHQGIQHNRPNSPVTSGTRNLQTSPFCRPSDSLPDVNYFQLEFNPYTQDWSDPGLLTTDDSWTGVPHLVGYSENRTQGFDVDPRTLDGWRTNTIDLKANETDALATNGGVYELEGGTQVGGDPTLALQGSDNHDAPYFLVRINSTRCTGITVDYRLRDLNNVSTAAQQIAVQARVGNSGNFTNFAYHANANTGGDTLGTATLDSSFDNQQRIEIRWLTTNASGNDNMIGVDDIKVSGTCTPTTVDDNAGWYRLKDSVTVTQDSFGNITSSLTDIYTSTNWEFVRLPISQRQNFANWYSYYRTRTNSAKTAMSRAFAPFNEAIRVAWQNLHTSLIDQTDAAIAPFGARQQIFRFLDEADTNNVRTRFYDWLFQIPASGGTPNIAATNRVGEYFKRGNGYDDDSDPYWDRTLGRELSCRQNFHINMSDGFWNGGNPQPIAPRRYIDTSIASLPDGRAYSTGDAESSIFHRRVGTQVEPTIADVMFHYWATDLRPDFTGNVTTALRVPPFIPDRSTNVFGTPLGSGQDPRDNKEIYWNPANDPATWAHMVNFNISFGLSGTLPQTQEVYEELREGTSTTFRWPYPVVGTDDRRKLDDFWHAALVSRGRFLSAKNPEELITALQEVIASIIARRGASTAVSVSLPIITDGTTGYTAGYDTTDWSGFVTRNELDQSDASIVGIEWDAGCLLTGGACATTAQTGLTPRDPDSRAIFTSSGTPGTGVDFLWGNLTSLQQSRLNVDPGTLRLDLGTWTTDTFGDERVAYLRGVRTNETTASPRFRARSSVLGAVIRGQPIYVSSPTAGIPDMSFPEDSPEFIAATATTPNGYREFQNTHRNRAPTIYVGANDGMLHAFDARTGTERFAYVPNTVIENFRLTRSTLFEGGLTPTVDDKPLVTDVYINGRWRTVLLGSLRLGGRGIYLLDVTNPTTAAASNLPLWEFSNVAPAGDTATDCAAGARHCSSLGYTYDSINIARISYQHKWVAVVSSGYFPKDPLDPASNDTAANRTSLLVIDLATGQLIREIRTSTAPQAATAPRSFGLSQPAVMDVGSDFIDDVAIAGDLAGNLWRFDLTGDPADWTVDLMFTTYGPGGGPTPGSTSSPGELPLSSIPVVMGRNNNRAPIVIVGSGKFLGLEDRTAAIPQQSFYGINDYGTCGADAVDADACANYPIRPNELKVQKITQAGNAVRSICGFGDAGCTGAETPPADDDIRGWRIRLNIGSEAGERSFGGAFPFFSSNVALLRSIIPKGVDPCDPGARYGLMLVNAATGGAQVDPTETTPSRLVGGVVSTSTPPGEPITLRGGGNVVIAGLTERDGTGAIVNAAVVSAIRQSLSRADDVWHRSSWREILDD